MPKYTGKRQNLVRKYAGKEDGDIAESLSYVAGGLGAAFSMYSGFANPYGRQNSGDA